MDETKKRKKDKKRDKKSKRKKVKEQADNYDISSEDQLETKAVEDVLNEANEDKGLLPFE